MITIRNFKMVEVKFNEYILYLRVFLEKNRNKITKQNRLHVLFE